MAKKPTAESVRDPQEQLEDQDLEDPKKEDSEARNPESENPVDETPQKVEDTWEPKARGQCRYRYMMGSGELRCPLAEILKVHKDGTVDLEVDIPERGAAANPVVFEHVPRWIEPPVEHAGVPPSYDRP